MKVAVIIPYKTDRSFLKKAIDSVWAQSFDGPMLVIEAKGNHGVSKNLNDGIQKAIEQGADLIRYLCDDDELTPNSIQDTVDYFEKHPDVDFIHGNTIHFTIDNNVMHEIIPRIKEISFSDLMARNHINGGTQVYRREVFEKFGGFDENLWTGEEFEFHLRILKAGAKIGYINSFLYRYRRHATQKSVGKLSPFSKVDRIAEICRIRNKHRRG